MNVLVMAGLMTVGYLVVAWASAGANARVLGEAHGSFQAVIEALEGVRVLTPEERETMLYAQKMASPTPEQRRALALTGSEQDLIDYLDVELGNVRQHPSLTDALEEYKLIRG